MTSSGTYNFSLTNGEAVIAAYERIQVRAPSLRPEHMVTARRETNLLLAEWANKQVNLFKVEEFAIDLTGGTQSYTLESRTVMILDAWLRLNAGTSQQTDLYLTPMSRTEYASLASKQTPGRPTVYWFNRLISPELFPWPVPDADGYQFGYYACVQMQDANLPGGETPDLPYLWLDALVAGLSHRVARVYRPELEQIRKQDAKDAWDTAATQNVENVDLQIAPNIGAYYRR
jgi:hypothetical protein